MSWRRLPVSIHSVRNSSRLCASLSTRWITSRRYSSTGMGVSRPSRLHEDETTLRVDEHELTANFAHRWTGVITAIITIIIATTTTRATLLRGAVVW